MKFNAILVFATAASALVITPRQACGGASAAPATVAAPAVPAAAAGGGLQKGGQTLVLKEIGGIAGNDCITFRNNGKPST